MRLSILNGRVIDPANSLDKVTDLFIDSDRIIACGKAPDGFEPELTIDAKNRHVIPGIVDLCAQVREPGASHKATIFSETRAAASAGITTLCVPPNTSPVIDSTSVVEMLRQRAREANGARIQPLAAATKGLDGELISEMAALKRAGCRAVSDGRKPILNTLVLRRAIEYANSQGLPVFLTPEDPYLADGCANEGWIATRLGLPFIPEAAETSPLARQIELVKQLDVIAHFNQLSCARSAKLLKQAQQDGVKVSADVSAHQLFLTEVDIAEFNANCHVRPPLRGQSDREGLRQAVASGVIAAICSDHQPHEPDAKLAPFPEAEPGISGIETLLPLTLRLVEEKVLTLTQAIERLTSGPAKIANLNDGAGTLSIGALADIVVYDPKTVWQLDASQMRSQGKNTPFLKWEFTGQVTHTIIGGEIVFAR